MCAALGTQVPHPAAASTSPLSFRHQYGIAPCKTDRLSICLTLGSRPSAVWCQSEQESRGDLCVPHRLAESQAQSVGGHHVRLLASTLF